MKRLSTPPQIIILVANDVLCSCHGGCDRRDKQIGWQHCITLVSINNPITSPIKPVVVDNTLSLPDYVRDMYFSS